MRGTKRTLGRALCFLLGALSLLAFPVGCSGDSKAKDELAPGCEEALTAFKRCFPNRDDVSSSLRESFRVAAKSEQDVQALMETCRVEASRLREECP